ncbi:MAG: hypothetical protein PHY31_05850 [Smithellaceae bacterium]|nr:hypothetical protein [Smithellaceae bacterium]
MTDGKYKTIALLEILTAIGIILFWIGFFTIGMAPETPPACYFAYEHSFPPPDTVLSLILIYGGIMLWKGNPRGRTLSLVGAGGLVFLGLLDASFNYQNGIYALSTMDLVLNGFINVWCVILGIAIVAGLNGRRGGRDD